MFHMCCLLRRGIHYLLILLGYYHYFVPLLKITVFSFQVWFAAVNQAFFSLSIGFGVVGTLASYNHFRNNVYLDAAVISYIDGFTSIFGGITTFAIVGHLADQMGVKVSEVVRGGGISLAFISYPDALARFTFLPQVRLCVWE